MARMADSRYRSPDWKPGTRLVAAALMICLAALLMFRLRELLAPTILGLLLAYLLNPVVGLLVGRFHLPHWAGVLLVFIGLLGLLIGATTGAGLAVWQQLAGVLRDLASLSANLPSLLQTLSQQRYVIGPWVLDLSRISLDPLVQSLISSLQPMLTQTGGLLATVATATASTVGMLVITLVLAFYLLLQFGGHADLPLELIPSPYREDFRRLAEDSGRIWQAFFRGQLLLGAVVGVLVTVVLSLMGLRFSLGLGIIAGLLEFVPMFGPAIAGAIAVLVALFQGGNWWGLSPLGLAGAVLIAFVIIQQIENNIFVPRIIGHSLNLSPLVVLLAALSGGILAGLLGVLLAAPVVATLRLWLGYVYRKTVGIDAMPAPVFEPTPTPAGVNRSIHPGRALARWFRWLRRTEEKEADDL
jgi:predicted PurR-regulated permease PerM